MKRWALAPILAGAVLGITVAAAGTAQESLQLRIDAVELSAYPQAQATVTVLDGSGRPVTGLAQPEFTADDGAGKAVPVLGVSAALDADVPAAVVLVIDASGSMKGVAIEQARAGAKTLVAELGPNDQVAVVTFSDDVQTRLEFTNDRAALNAAIDGIVATGNTALYDGVIAGVATATGSGAQRRAVVLLSDGLDFGGASETDRSSSLSAAQASGAPFFVVGLGDSVDQAYLQELANVTRGQLFLAPSPDALQGLYETIGAALRSQYIVDLDISSLDPATATKLRVQVNHAGIAATGETNIDLSRFVAETPVPATATPRVTAAPTPEVEPTPIVETEDGGGSLLVPVAAAAAIVVLAGGGGLLVWRRRRAGAVEGGEIRRPTRRDPDQPVFMGTGPLGNERPDAWLELASGGQAERFPLGEDPVTVGFTGDCTICLPDGAGQAAARVRVWKREGVYMLHNLSRLIEVKVGGKPATWVVLEDGDMIEMGRSRLVFRTAE